MVVTVLMAFHIQPIITDVSEENVFDPEFGGNIFLRNVDSSLSVMT